MCRYRAYLVFSNRTRSTNCLPSSTRSALRSQTATMRLSRPATPVNWSTPGMSWPREMRPAPMAPMLMRLEGAVAPKTELGTMAGNPAAMAVVTEPWMNPRLVVLMECSLGPDRRGGPNVHHGECEGLRRAISDRVVYSFLRISCGRKKKSVGMRSRG